MNKEITLIFPPVPAKHYWIHPWQHSIATQSQHLLQNLHSFSTTLHSSVSLTSFCATLEWKIKAQTGIRLLNMTFCFTLCI